MPLTTGAAAEVPANHSYEASVRTSPWLTVGFSRFTVPGAEMQKFMAIAPQGFEYPALVPFKGLIATTARMFSNSG